MKERFDLFCRADAEMVARLDAWTRRTMGPAASRSMAIRILLERALDEADRKRK